MDQISLNEAARAVGGKNDKDANVSGVFIAMGQAVCYNETNIDLRRRTMIWTEGFWRSR